VSLPLDFANLILRAAAGSFVILTLLGTPAKAACWDPLGPTNIPVPAGAGSVMVKARPGCAGSATINVPWLSQASSVGAPLLWQLAGRQRLGLIARPNTTGQAGAEGTPYITDGGIVNSASFMLASSPGAGIAAGSIFSIFGENLGPATPVQGNTYPLATQLGGVSVKISQGAKSWDAIPVFVSSGQINAILPSQASPGDSQISVMYQLASSDPAPITILSANFGIFGVIGGGAGPGVIQNYNSA
jgi:hypothetical protein